MSQIRLLCLLVAASTVSCGIFQSDDNGTSNNPVAPNFSLTGSETSDIDSTQVTSQVARSSALLKKFSFQIMNLNNVTKTSEQYSSGKNTNFGTCVSTQIANTPLAVTSDTIGFNLDLDFITLCDSPLEEKDLVGELKNKLTVSVQIGCAGIGITGESMRTAGDLLRRPNPEDFCGAQRFAAYSYTYTLDARKSVKQKKPDNTISVTGVSSVLYNESLSALSGGPCSRVLLGDEKNSKEVSGCQQIVQSRTFGGKPEDEINSPKETLKGRPVVIQWIASVENASQESDASSYRSANTKFKLNGWEGQVNYTNGWAAPTWSATLPATSGKVEGKL